MADVRELTLSTISDLDDRIDKVIQQELQRAARDCRERPEEGKPRKVMLQIELTPVFEDGECGDINVQFFVDGKNPTRRTRLYRVGVNRQNKLFFSPDNPQDISQPGFDFQGEGEQS